MRWQWISLSAPQKSLLSEAAMFAAVAPNTFLIPISFVLLCAVDMPGLNKPMHEMKMVIPIATFAGHAVFCSCPYSQPIDSLSKL
jgi:hypothetical protein